MESILIKDTTKEQREQIVAESIGNISGSCDGCMAGLADMYQDFDSVKDITQTTIWSVYPKYYPSGAVQFFSNHHA